MRHDAEDTDPWHGRVLLLGKRRGLLPSVADGLEKPSNAGLWLSDDLVTLLKTQAGE